MKRTSIIRLILAFAIIFGLYLTVNATSTNVVAQDQSDDLIKQAQCLRKTTNGLEVSGPDDPNIPKLSPGTAIVWRYFVQNTGNVDIRKDQISVSDNQGVNPVLDESSDANNDSVMSPEEVWIWEANGSAKDLNGGTYENIGESVVTFPDGPSKSTCRSYYVNPVVPNPGIDIEKSTNGRDADNPKGPFIEVGDKVEWEYVVTNTGDVVLDNIVVNDNRLGQISCPRSSLGPGEKMTCSATGTAQEGQYSNQGCVEGTAPDGSKETDCDSSHYYSTIDEIVEIPEPITVILFGTGLAALSGVAARRRKKAH